MSEPKVTRRGSRHEATKREILDAAWDLARERGLTGWSLRELATIVGMRPPSLYVYFASKNDVYDAMFREGYDQLRALVDATPRPQEPAELLRLAARTYVEFCVQDPPRFQLLFLRTIPGFEPSPSSYSVALDVLESTRQVLAQAGADRPQDLDLWTALATGLAAQQISNDPGGDRWLGLVDDAMTMFARRIRDSTP
jgi:AcrR family transcriptional regulator